MSLLGRLKCGSCKNVIWGMDEVVLTDCNTVIHAQCFPNHALNETEKDRGRFFESIERYELFSKYE